MDVDQGSADYSDLVQQSQQLIADADMPRMKRNLQQIKDSALRLASRAPIGAPDSADVKAWAFIPLLSAFFPHWSALSWVSFITMHRVFTHEFKKDDKASE